MSSSNDAPASLGISEPKPQATEKDSASDTTAEVDPERTEHKRDTSEARPNAPEAETLHTETHEPFSEGTRSKDSSADATTRRPDKVVSRRASDTNSDVLATPLQGSPISRESIRTERRDDSSSDSHDSIEETGAWINASSADSDSEAEHRPRTSHRSNEALPSSWKQRWRMSLLRSTDLSWAPRCGALHFEPSPASSADEWDGFQKYLRSVLNADHGFEKFIL